MTKSSMGLMVLIAGLVLCVGTGVYVGASLMAKDAPQEDVRFIWQDTAARYLEEGHAVEVILRATSAFPHEDMPEEDTAANLAALCSEHAPRAIKHVAEVLDISNPQYVSIVVHSVSGRWIFKETRVAREDFTVAGGGCEVIGEDELEEG